MDARILFHPSISIAAADLNSSDALVKWRQSSRPIAIRESEMLVIVREGVAKRAPAFQRKHHNLTGFSSLSLHPQQSVAASLVTSDQ